MDREYYTSPDIELYDVREIPCENISQIFMSDKERLYGVEFIVNNIAENEEGVLILSIYSIDELLYKTRISLSNIENYKWKRIYVNLPLKRGKYRISFQAQECAQIPNMLLIDKSKAPSESVYSIVGDMEVEDAVALKYGYLREIATVDIWMNFLFWCIVLFLCTIGLYYFEYLYGCVKRGIACLLMDSSIDLVSSAFELILCLVIINSSGIEFQEPTKIIFYLVSLCSVWKLNRKSVWVKEQQKEFWKKISLHFLYFYAAFSLVGQRIFIYPLNKNITLGG